MVYLGIPSLLSLARQPSPFNILAAPRSYRPPYDRIVRRLDRHRKTLATPIAPNQQINTPTPLAVWNNRVPPVKDVEDPINCKPM
jgi:hypothetical protein